MHNQTSQKLRDKKQEISFSPSIGSYLGQNKRKIAIFVFDKDVG